MWVKLPLLGVMASQALFRSRNSESKYHIRVVRYRILEPVKRTPVYDERAAFSDLIKHGDGDGDCVLHAIGRTTCGCRTST